MLFLFSGSLKWVLNAAYLICHVCRGIKLYHSHIDWSVIFYSSIFLLFLFLAAHFYVTTPSFHALSFSSAFPNFPISYLCILTFSYLVCHFLLFFKFIFSLLLSLSCPRSPSLFPLFFDFFFACPFLLCHHLPMCNFTNFPVITVYSLCPLFAPSSPSPPHPYIPPVARCWRSTSPQVYTSWALSAGSWPFACSSSSPSSTSASGRESRRLER